MVRPEISRLETVLIKRKAYYTMKMEFLRQLIVILDRMHAQLEALHATK